MGIDLFPGQCKNLGTLWLHLLLLDFCVIVVTNFNFTYIWNLTRDNYYCFTWSVSVWVYLYICHFHCSSLFSAFSTFHLESFSFWLSNIFSVAQRVTDFLIFCLSENVFIWSSFFLDTILRMENFKQMQKWRHLYNESLYPSLNFKIISTYSTCFTSSISMQSQIISKQITNIIISHL